MRKLLLLIFGLLIGCSTNVSTTPQDFDSQAIELVNIIDKRMQNKEDLNEAEKHKLEMFISEYATEDQKERKSYLTTLIVSLYATNSSIILEESASERLEYMRSYNETLVKVRAELDLDE